jgi:oligopeptide transport system substrate-binding protein
MKHALKIAVFSIFASTVTLPASAKTLNAFLPGPPVNLDWNGLATMIEAPLILNLNEGLFTYRFPEQTLVPGIAESLAKSTDLTEYTFKIRKDAKWSDGRNIRAADFRDAWLRVLSPQSVSIYTYYLFDIENAKEYNQKEITDASKVGITVVDDLTLKVKLKLPRPRWEANTAFWPLFPIRSDQIERFGTNWWRPGALISSGPFILDSYETGKKVILKRNPYYPKIESDITEIDFQVDSPEEAAKKYKSGYYEFLWGIPRNILEKKVSKKAIQEMRIMRVYFLALNAAKFPTNNREFRMAILKAISKNALLPKGNSDLIPISTLIPSPLPGSKESLELKFDPKEAKAHLEKSGILTQSKFKLRVLTNIFEPFQTIGRNLEAELVDHLGLNVDLAALPGLEYTTYMNLGDYDLALITWTAKVLSSEDFLLPYSGEAAFNRLNYRNSVFDQWLFDGMKAKDASTVEKSLRMAQSVFIIEEGVGAPLFTEKATFLQSKSIKNIYFNHMGIPILKSATH